MRDTFIEAYEDFTKTRKKCGACYKMIWILLVACILLIGGGVALYVYVNQYAAMIALSIGISLGLTLGLLFIAICIGWCLRPESVLPVSVGRQ